MSDITRFLAAALLIALALLVLANMESDKDECIARGGEPVMSYPFGVACVEGR